MNDIAETIPLEPDDFFRLRNSPAFREALRVALREATTLVMSTPSSDVERILAAKRQIEGVQYVESIVNKLASAKLSTITDR